MSVPLHYIPLVEWHKPQNSFLCGAQGSGTNKTFSVTCQDCKDMLAQGKRRPEPATGLVHYTRGAKPWRCGAMDGSAVNIIRMVNCDDCLTLINGGGLEAQPPRHTPPLMNENGDGIFLFHDVHLGAGYTLEVVPQVSGNVEITIEDAAMNGHLFTLSHLDRADLLRALLHDFHYSPERGGPHDEG